jgi:TolB-like protein
VQVSAARPDNPPRARPTVFLSYASEDRRAAQLIRDALPGFGMEVWYDESDLLGGDAWDQKIRGQIRACDFFMPVISAHTEARHEGYFRREWRLAVERTLDMADDHVFLLPVVIDDTPEAGARVPERFRSVQWLRLPEGRPTAALEALCRRLAAGETTTPASRAVAEPPAARVPPVRGGAFPPFPREEPGQRARFWFQVAGWALQCAWVAFKRLPKWLRILVYVWAALLIASRGCSDSRDTRVHALSSAERQRLKQIASSHSGNWTPADTAKLLAQIAKEIPADSAVATTTPAPVLAIPFAAPAADAAAQKLAGSVFTELYGRLAIARHGQVALAGRPLPTLQVANAVQQARSHHADYVVCGAVGGSAPDQQLTVMIISAADGSTLWSRSYPLHEADPADIAAQVSARVPRQRSH